MAATGALLSSLSRTLLLLALYFKTVHNGHPNQARTSTLTGPLLKWLKGKLSADELNTQDLTRNDVLN